MTKMKQLENLNFTRKKECSTPLEKKMWISRIGDVLGRVRDFFLSRRQAKTESVQDILNETERIIRVIHALQALKEDAQGKIDIPQIEDEPNKDKIGQYKSVKVINSSLKRLL